MEPSQACFDLIKASEKCRLKAYLDPVGIPTIGWGHTSTSVRLGDVITQEQADKYLTLDVGGVVKDITSMVLVPLTQGQFDALVDFAYNVGPARLKRSTLLQKLNARDYVGASEEFSRWNEAAGKVLAGLIKRRNAEKALFTQELKV